MKKTFSIILAILIITLGSYSSSHLVSASQPKSTQGTQIRPKLVCKAGNTYDKIKNASKEINDEIYDYSQKIIADGLRIIVSPPSVSINNHSETIVCVTLSFTNN